MFARKENQEFTITESDVQSFAREGFDVYDDSGNLIAYGAGKAVPYAKYAKLMEQVEALQDEIIALKEKIKVLESKKKG